MVCTQQYLALYISILKYTTINTGHLNLPYTMIPEMGADTAKAFKLKTLYPYYSGNTDASEIVELLIDGEGIAVQIGK